MTLVELNARFYRFRAVREGHGRQRIPTDDMADAKGVEFDCPGCAGTERAHRLYMPFYHANLGHRIRWHVRGTSLHDLTFVDGPGGYTRSMRVLGDPCHSHFNVTEGRIEHYPDSHSP